MGHGDSGGYGTGHGNGGYGTGHCCGHGDAHEGIADNAVEGWDGKYKDGSQTTSEMVAATIGEDPTGTAEDVLGVDKLEGAEAAPESKVIELRPDAMPDDRADAKKLHPVVRIKYEEAGVDYLAVDSATGKPICNHDSCRNNPNATAPFSLDCTPQRYELPPNGATKVLLHSCCAPCSGAMFEEMLAKGLDVTIFFYNPNIHPKLEYEIRKEENKRYARKHNVPFIDCDYDEKSWFNRMKGLEFDPERGARCTACFDMRMEVTAAYAAEKGFGCFTTTNATSRWKDVDQVNQSGFRAAQRYSGVDFWEYNWQTDGMTLRKYEVSAEERFYKQEYCGCLFSLRDSNLWRKKEGIPPVKIGGETAGLGDRWFMNPEEDAEEESQEVVDAFFKAAETQFDNERLQRQYEGRKKNVDVAELNNW